MRGTRVNEERGSERRIRGGGQGGEEVGDGEVEGGKKRSREMWGRREGGG